MAVAVLIDWLGPYDTIKELEAAAREFGFGEALYLAIGRRPRQRTPHIQYVGITKDLTRRFNGCHPIQALLKADGLRLFIGQVSSQAVAGRQGKSEHVKFSTSLYIAEGALAFLMEVPLNKDRRTHPPKKSVVVVNRWYKHDFWTRRRNRPHPSWPDLVEYDQEGTSGYLAWHTGVRRKNFDADGLQQIGERARKQKAALEAKAAKAAAAVANGAAPKAEEMEAEAEIALIEE